MGKHTLRYLDEQQYKVKKKKDSKNSFFKNHLLIIFAIIVLILSALITNIILFADEFFYINSCTLGYEVDCAGVSSSAITAYVILMLLPIALTVFAIVRAFQKKQKRSAIVAILLAIIAILTPLAIPSIYSSYVSRYDQATILSIEAPNNNCKLIGLTPNDNSTCRIHSGAAPFSGDKLHNTAQIAVKTGDDLIIVHLDTNLNILNATKQNIHVCSYINGSSTADCYELRYSDEKASVQEDIYYTYSYLHNKLTITPKQ